MDLLPTNRMVGGDNSRSPDDDDGNCPRLAWKSTGARLLEPPVFFCIRVTTFAVPTSLLATTLWCSPRYLDRSSSARSAACREAFPKASILAATRSCDLDLPGPAFPDRLLGWRALSGLLSTDWLRRALARPAFSFECRKSLESSSSGLVILLLNSFCRLILLSLLAAEGSHTSTSGVDLEFRDDFLLVAFLGVTGGAAEQRSFSVSRSRL